MKHTELGEDIIDDILADFPQFRKHLPDTSPRKLPVPQPSKAREPVKVKGVEHDSFSQWIRSKDQVRHALQDKLGTTKASLENCIKLYTEHNIKIDDFVVLQFPTQDVYPFREYDRAIDDKDWTGKMTKDEYEELMQSIQNEGISNPGIIEISNFKDGNYEVILGEGNHRLKIAMELGIKLFPISFYYRFA
jgi:hypothetical protein